MTTFSYVDSSGRLQNYEANDPNSAIAGAPNRNPRSGVINPPLLSTQSTRNPAPTRRAPAPIRGRESDPLGSFDEYRRNNRLDPIELGRISSSYSSRLQAEMDLINSKFNKMVAGDTELNRGALARTKVLNANTGLVNSGTGATATGETEKKGAAIIAADEEQRAASLDSALGMIDNLKQSAIAEATAQKRNDLTAYTALRAENAKKSDEALKTYIESGGDLEKLKQAEPNSYNTFVKSFGGEEMLKAKAIAYEPKDTYVSDKPEIIGNKAVFFKKDRKTGAISQVTLDLPAKVTGGKAIKQIMRVPGEATYIFFTDGSYKQVGQGGSVDTASDKNNQSAGLNWLRRQPGYNNIDEAKFKDDPEFQAYVVNQALLEKKAKTTSNPF